MASIGATAVANKGRTTGFDYLRLGLALAVVAVHCLGIGDPFWSQWLQAHRAITALILTAFFALSGFLVTGSLFRNTIPEFMTLRAVRIVPALAFEITLSALLIGPCFTQLPAHAYYTSPDFAAYFLNIVGDIHFYLPGVFGGAAVNAQLWTIPYELECYAMLVGVALITVLPIRRFFPFALLLSALGLTAWASHEQVDWSMWHPSGRSLVCAFLWASVLYLFRDRIPYRATMAAAALVAAEVILRNPHYEALATLPIAYLTVYIGLMALPPIRFGDLSYGIFLFHYPILQTLRFGPRLANPWALLAATALMSGICALISWNLIEQPILQRKNAILVGLNRMIDLLTRRRSRLAQSPEIASTAKESGATTAEICDAA